MEIPDSPEKSILRPAKRRYQPEVGPIFRRKLSWKHVDFTTALTDEPVSSGRLTPRPAIHTLPGARGKSRKAPGVPENGNYPEKYEIGMRGERKLWRSINNAGGKRESGPRGTHVRPEPEEAGKNREKAEAIEMEGKYPGSPSLPTALTLYRERD